MPIIASSKRAAVAKPSSSKPYISINKLAEYMSADAIRRRQIITSLKKDSDFTKVYYSEVKNMIVPFFKSDFDLAILEDAIKKIRKKVAITDWDASDNANSIEALECMLDTDWPDLGDYKIITSALALKSVKLANVDVTIKPEIYLKHKSGKVGAVKIHIAKTPANRLADDNRIYAATLLKYAYVEYGVNEKLIDHDVCFSFDIFQKQYSVGAASFKRRISALEASCEEIALRWGSI